MFLTEAHPSPVGSAMAQEESSGVDVQMGLKNRKC